MNADASIESEVTEPVEELEVTNDDVSDMDDEKFAEHYEKVGEADNGDTDDGSDDDDLDGDDDSKAEPDLDGEYVKQMETADAKLSEPILIKVDGSVMKIDSINDLKNMAEKAAGAAKAFQAIAADTKTIGFLKDNNISQDDLLNIINSKGVQPIIKDAPSESQVEIDSLITSIEQSDYADAFVGSIESLPQDAIDDIGNDPAILKVLSNEFTNGYGQQIMPHVKQEMIVKGVNFVTAYENVGRRLIEQKKNVDTNKDVLNTISKTKGNGSKASVTSDSVMGMSGDDFDKYYASL